MCNHCNGKGIIRVCFQDGSPTDYAVCLCPDGMRMRDTANAGKGTGFALWQVWAYREQVDPERVCMLEELQTDEELVAMGFSPVGTISAGVMDEADLISIGRRKVKL